MLATQSKPHKEASAGLTIKNMECVNITRTELRGVLNEAVTVCARDWKGINKQNSSNAVLEIERGNNENAERSIPY